MPRKPRGEVAPATTAPDLAKHSPTRQAASASSAATIVNGDGDTNMGDQHERGPSGQLPDGARTAQTDNSDDTLDEDSDAALELLGQGMKALLTLVQNLRDLGVEDLVLPLPKIAVVGDQSTGKSSLIEGISGIKVPRSSGTCTRCPLEINLTNTDVNGQWKCSIYLVKTYIYEGSQVLLPFGKTAAPRGEGATRNRPFGPWLAQGLTESSLFYKTNNKADVTQALRLAQLATLNPGTDPARFFPGAKPNPDDRIQVKFSPNKIRLEISSPDGPDLSFYDLPGVINQAEIPEEEYLVKLVANLVTSYIETDSCINLLAMPMTDDAANSTASKLVQKLGAQDRTVGCLTKPDRVQGGESMSQWIDILNGKKFKVGHGYYVVKNNSDPNVSNTLARQQENDFFNEEPWIHTLGSHRDRFGTFKLSAVLSRLLNLQIRTSLPRITEQVRSKTAEIIARLKEMPEPPKGNLSLKIFEKILVLENDLHCHFDGGSEEYPFQKEFHTAAVRFRNTIAFSYPRLSLAGSFATFKTSSQLPYRPSATPTPPGNQRAEIIPIDSDGECPPTQRFTPTSTPSKRKQVSSSSAPFTPSKRSRLDQVPQYLPSQDSVANGSDSSNMTIDRAAPFAKRFTLTDIRTILQDAHIGLPNQIDPKATKRMIRESLSHWDGPLEELLQFTRQTCLAMIIERASCVFGLWHGTRCFDLLMEISQSFFEEQFDRQTEAAKRVLAVERQLAWTLHEDAMRTASEKVLTTLENACRNERVKALLTKQDPDWDENLSERAKADKMSKVTDAHLGPNPYTHELRAIADVRGYYECAFSRFVDVISQGIQAELFTACRNELGNALKQRIGLEEKDAEQRCAILLAVDPQVEKDRAELLKQKENLMKACTWFESQ
ncbi:MAG: hypothetical protein Q9166_000178 [cf. Caloplaca sp. 2 TL-2023]